LTGIQGAAWYGTKRTKVVPISRQNRPRRGRSGNGCIGAVMPNIAFTHWMQAALQGPLKSLSAKTDRKRLRRPSD
jgi:hypothetical protein